MNILHISKLFIALMLATLNIEYNMAIAQPSEPNPENIKLQWAFGAIKQLDGQPKLVAIEQDTVLKSGDQIKFFIQLKTNSFAYLLYHGSRDEIHVLFPNQFTQPAHSPQQQYFIPQGDNWIKLDKQVGQETFYFLVSTERLHHLEQLITEYQEKSTTNKTQLTKQILKEARTLIWKNRKFKRAAEKPVTIMGRLRSADMTNMTNHPHDITHLAMEVSGNHFYGRTFTIDHQ